MEENRELNEYELNPQDTSRATSNAYWWDSYDSSAEAKEVKFHNMRRFLSNKNLAGQTIKRHYFYDEIFVLAECLDETNIDLMLIEICNGGDNLHQIAHVIYKNSPLMRHHDDLVVYARKCQKLYREEQQKIKDEIEQIYEDRESGRGGSSGGENEFITPFL